MVATSSDDIAKKFWEDAEKETNEKGVNMFQYLAEVDNVVY